MDEPSDKPEEAAGSTASIISVSAVPCSTGSQLILNGSSGFLAASQPLLLNGNSLISGAGAGVIINGLSLGDCQTVTLSPVPSGCPLILNGAQVIAKPGVSAPQHQAAASGSQPEASAVESKAGVLSSSCMPTPEHPTIISPPLQSKAKSGNGMDFIVGCKSEGGSQTVSPSFSSLSPSPPAALPSLVLTQNPPQHESLSLPSSLSSAGVISNPSVQREASPSHLTTSTVSSIYSTPHVISLPQVVPSIHRPPVSHLVQTSLGAQCPQLVPVSPLTSLAPQFQIPQTQNPGSRPPDQQRDPPATVSESAATVVSVSQRNNGTLQQINSTPIKVQTPQVLSMSSPTPASQAKSSTSAHLVSLSMPQLVPVSSIQTSSNVSFPQVVPASPTLSIPSAGLPMQILASAPGSGGAQPTPLRINQLSQIQRVGNPTSVAPAVQLLNPGIIQLPSSPTGKNI